MAFAGLFAGFFDGFFAFPAVDAVPRDADVAEAVPVVRFPAGFAEADGVAADLAPDVFAAVFTPAGFVAVAAPARFDLGGADAEADVFASLRRRRSSAFAVVCRPISAPQVGVHGLGEQQIGRAHV